MAGREQILKLGAELVESLAAERPALLGLKLLEDTFTEMPKLERGAGLLRSEGKGNSAYLYESGALNFEAHPPLGAKELIFDGTPLLSGDGKRNVARFLQSGDTLPAHPAATADTRTAVRKLLDEAGY